MSNKIFFTILVTIFLSSFSMMLQAAKFVSPYKTNQTYKEIQDEVPQLLQPAKEKDTRVKLLSVALQKEAKAIALKKRKEKARKKAIREKKIAQAFAKKETLSSVKKKKINLKTSRNEANFFNSLKEDDTKPINMEE